MIISYESFSLQQKTIEIIISKGIWNKLKKIIISS